MNNGSAAAAHYTNGVGSGELFNPGIDVRVIVLDDKGWPNPATVRELGLRNNIFGVHYDGLRKSRKTLQYVPSERVIGPCSVSPQKYRFDTVLLEGTIDFQFRNGVCYQVINGSWSNDVTMSPSRSFKLTRMVPPIEGERLLDGEFSFDGSFQFDNEDIHESGVKILLQRRFQEMFSVNGRGFNKFGTFKLLGFAKKVDDSTYSIRLRKCYIIEMGTPFTKLFNDKHGKTRPFRGHVKSYNVEKDWYRVLYEDGDKEDLAEEEMINLVLSSQVSKDKGCPKKAKGRNQRKQKKLTQAAGNKNVRKLGVVREKKLLDSRSTTIVPASHLGVLAELATKTRLVKNENSAKNNQPTCLKYGVNVTASLGSDKSAPTHQEHELSTSAATINDIESSWTKREAHKSNVENQQQLLKDDMSMARTEHPGELDLLSRQQFQIAENCKIIKALRAISTTNTKIVRSLDSRAGQMEESANAIFKVLQNHDDGIMESSAKIAAFGARQDENRSCILKLQECISVGWGGDDTKPLVAQVENIQESLRRRDDKMNCIVKDLSDTCGRVRALEKANKKSNKRAEKLEKTVKQLMACKGHLRNDSPVENFAGKPVAQKNHGSSRQHKTCCKPIATIVGSKHGALKCKSPSGNSSGPKKVSKTHRTAWNSQDEGRACYGTHTASHRDQIHQAVPAGLGKFDDVDCVGREDNSGGAPPHCLTNRLRAWRKDHAHDKSSSGQGEQHHNKLKAEGRNTRQGVVGPSGPGSSQNANKFNILSFSMHDKENLGVKEKKISDMNLSVSSSSSKCSRGGTKRKRTLDGNSKLNILDRSSL